MRNNSPHAPHKKKSQLMVHTPTGHPPSCAPPLSAPSQPPFNHAMPLTAASPKKVRRAPAKKAMSPKKKTAGKKAVARRGGGIVDDLAKLAVPFGLIAAKEGLLALKKKKRAQRGGGGALAPAPIEPEAVVPKTAEPPAAEAFEQDGGAAKKKRVVKKKATSPKKGKVSPKKKVSLKKGKVSPKKKQAGRKMCGGGEDEPVGEEYPYTAGQDDVGDVAAAEYPGDQTGGAAAMRRRNALVAQEFRAMARQISAILGKPKAKRH